MPRISRLEQTIAHYRDQPDACWDFLGYRRPDGYGEAFYNGAVEYAHRASYMRLVGPIPEGLTLDHLCRNPSCINPKHLEPVTHRENMLRGNTVGARHAARTHCPQGHPYSPENTSTDGHSRRCKECNRARSRANWAPGGYYHRAKASRQRP